MLLSVTRHPQYKLSRGAGEKERRLVVGEEFKEYTKDGALVRMLLEQVSSTQLRVTIDWAGRGRILDTKTLLDGGLVMHQHVEFAHKTGKDKRSINNRYFVRAVDPASEV